MGDHKNILDAARYLNHNQETMFAKIPPLSQGNNLSAATPVDQAALLLETFFPSLPIITEGHAEQSNLNSLPLPNLTMDEVQVAISPHKAPGNNGLLAIVWSKLWPVINLHVLSLFQSSLD